jgi:hypothetical protein
MNAVVSVLSSDPCRGQLLNALLKRLRKFLTVSLLQHALDAGQDVGRTAVLKEVHDQSVPASILIEGVDDFACFITGVGEHVTS